MKKTETKCLKLIVPNQIGKKNGYPTVYCCTAQYLAQMMFITPNRDMTEVLTINMHEMICTLPRVCSQTIAEC